ncbi:MAG: HAMP domain-containing protein [Hyphomicrobiales bacterium]|nr:HAMP domain-containing protein [Hyphomicrobiales bacterium]
MNTRVPGFLEPSHQAWRKLALWLRARMPKGLFARTLLILILPMVLLQALLAYVFMERHWEAVTHRLSAAMTRDIAALIDIYETYPQDKDSQQLTRIAAERLNMIANILPKAPLPPPAPKPFFSLLDQTLSEELARQVARPFWIDTVGTSNFVEIRVQLKDAQLRVIAPRVQAYASNSWIFLSWMIGAALALIGVAILYLRNQVRPIRRLALAAEEFGKGRDTPFRPSGAREVRQAGQAFLAMKRRLERARDQRTAMLSGVSHDLRTVLTRFKLSLAMLGEGAEQDAMRRDVEEMQRMLEAYLAFARGAAGEAAVDADARALIESVVKEAARQGVAPHFVYEGEAHVQLRPDAFRRCLANLIGNAQRYGKTINVTATRDARHLVVCIDDDGPGVPPQSRETVFRPFFKLDEARNQDEAGAGLGLAIARDIARLHGGDVTLEDSPLGGLRARVVAPA